MSIEDRLFALAQQYAGQHGPAALADQATMISQLSSQAPDLHAEVRALAAAVSVNAGSRIAAAGNADLEAQAIGGEIAASQKLAMASVMPAIAVLRRLAAAGEMPTPAPVMPAPADAGWAGDSVVAGATPAAAAVPSAPPPVAAPPLSPPAPVQADKPIWQNKWAIGGAAAVALLLAYQNFAKPTGPSPTPTATAGPTGPSIGPSTPGAPAPLPTFSPQAPGQSAGLPELAGPGGQMPTLLVRQQGQGFVVGFTLRGVAAMVAAPQGGWDRGPGMIALARNAQAQQPDSVGSGMFQRTNSDQGPSRLMRVQWQQDNLNAGPMCVAFVGTSGQDVNPSGSRLCVLDGGCGRAVACGQLPTAAAQSGGGGMQPGQ